ncbi:hypothetical protein ACC728_37275 [Rhizobium ruizarguesonis]
MKVHRHQVMEKLGVRSEMPRA